MDFVHLVMILWHRLNVCSHPLINPFVSFRSTRTNVTVLREIWFSLAIWSMTIRRIQKCCCVPGDRHRNQKRSKTVKQSVNKLRFLQFLPHFRDSYYKSSRNLFAFRCNFSCQPNVYRPSVRCFTHFRISFTYLPNKTSNSAAAEAPQEHLQALTVVHTQTHKAQCILHLLLHVIATAHCAHPSTRRTCTTTQTEHFKRKISYLHNYSNYSVFSSRFIDQNETRANDAERTVIVVVAIVGSVGASPKWKCGRNSANRVAFNEPKNEMKAEHDEDDDAAASSVGSRTSCAVSFRI